MTEGGYATVEVVLGTCSECGDAVLAGHPAKCRGCYRETQGAFGPVIDMRSADEAKAIAAVPGGLPTEGSR